MSTKLKYKVAISIDQTVAEDDSREALQHGWDMFCKGMVNLNYGNVDSIQISIAKEEK